MTIEFVVLTLMLFLIYMRYKTNTPIFELFAAMLAFYLASVYATTSILLTMIFALLAFYLIYETFLKRT